MDRRSFIAATAALGATAVTPSLTAEPMQTKWVVTQSEAFDAIVFFDALSGTVLCRPYYRDAAAAFGSKLESPLRADIVSLWNEARDAKFGLLGPTLASVLSCANPGSLNEVVDLLAAPALKILPSFWRSRNYSDADWRWPNSHAGRLARIFEAMRAANFAGFRRTRTGDLDCLASPTTWRPLPSLTCARYGDITPIAGGAAGSRRL